MTVHFGVTLPQIKRTWAEARDTAIEIERLGFDSVWVCDHLQGVPAPQLETVTYDGRFARAVDAHCAPKPVRRPPLLIGGSGEKVLLRIAARHADIWNNLAVTQDQLAHKIAVLRDHCAAAGRDFADITVSQQTNLVLVADEADAPEALAKAARIYGPMAAAMEEHGIWGSPPRVIEAIERHVALGCTHFVMELFGRDPRDPARLFANEVLPAFR